MKLITALCCCLQVVVAWAQNPQQQLAEIATHATQLRTIWPGFLTEFNHGIYQQNGELYLLSNHVDMTGWELKETTNELSVWFSQQDSLMGSNRGFVIGHQVPPDITIDAVAERKRAVNTLMHESFHGFMKQAAVQVNLNLNQLSLHSDWIKLKQLEFALLKDILNDAQSKAILNEQVAVYVGLRQHREAMMDSASLTAERNMEWSEGVATYVGLQAESMVYDEAFTTLLVDYGDWLAGEAADQSAEKFIRYDAYFHGAALSFLAAMFDADWQLAVMQGQSPFEILAAEFAAVKLDPSEVLQSLTIGGNNQIQQQQAFDAQKMWPQAVFIDNGLTLNPTFSPEKIDSKTNGNLVLEVQNIYSSSRFVEINAYGDAMFLGKQFMVIKLNEHTASLDGCDLQNNQTFQCAAGQTIEFSNVKLVAKQNLYVSRNGAQWYISFQ